MKLYRGDVVPAKVVHSSPDSKGRTFAKQFWSDGLMAKYIDGGTTDLLAKKDRLQLVLEHVGYVPDSSPQKLAYHSPMLSLSAIPDCAFRYMEHRSGRSLSRTPCQPLEASYFVWELDVDLTQLPEQKPGEYLLVYEADPVNCACAIDDEIARGVEEEANTGNADPLLSAIGYALSQANVAADQTEHYALIIDVVRYLDAHSAELAGRDGQLVANTYERATRDSEWLLYPCDPMTDGHGVSAKFWMNRHLKAVAWFRR